MRAKSNPNLDGIANFVVLGIGLYIFYKLFSSGPGSTNTSGSLLSKIFSNPASATSTPGGLFAPMAPTAGLPSSPTVSSNPLEVFFGFGTFTYGPNDEIPGTGQTLTQLRALGYTDDQITQGLQQNIGLAFPDDTSGISF